MSDRWIRSLWFCVLVALLARLIVVFTTTGAAYDIISYHLQAQSMFLHQNVYTFTDRYPYPPVWVWIVALVQLGANLTALPFVWLVKLPAVFADCLTVALLQWYKGTHAALVYAVNPVSLLITAGHGQFDGLVMACVVLAWVCWKKQYFCWAALALGVGIALKVYPVLLLPALIVAVQPHRTRFLVAGLALVPLLASMLLYTLLFGLNQGMILHVVGYASTPQFGWSLYLYLVSRTTLGGLSVVLRGAVLVLPLVVLRYRRAWSLELLWVATMLGFYVLAPGLSAQYLLWILPLFALADRVRQGWLFTACAFPVLCGFYLFYFPGVVPGGGLIATAIPRYGWFGLDFCANFLWWLLCIWLSRAMLKENKHGNSEGAAARRALAVSNAGAPDK